MSSTKRLYGAIATSVVALNLGGCVVAAIPMLMAAGVGVVAMAGFAVFKTVQTTGGGTMQIAFGSADSKRASPPTALPALTTVAVWPVGERERKFSETLSTSGKFHMVRLDNSPALPSSDAERSRGFAAQCKQSKVDMIFAAIDLGQTVKSNLMSFKRGSVTDKLQLEGYGCEAGKVIWTDTMATVIESGSKPTPQSEIDSAAGQAWAERVLQAVHAPLIESMTGSGRRGNKA